MAPPALVISEAARYTLTLYVLAITAVCFYMIYWASQTNFINDNSWADQHTLTSKSGNQNDEIFRLRNARNTYYTFSIVTVVGNLLVILYLIGTKFNITTRY